MGRKITSELDIVIPCYNNYKFSLSCIASIFKSTYPKDKLRIIVVDNNSSDRTENFIKYLVEEGEPILYLKQETNLGYVKGLNAGFKASTAPFIMSLNNDTILDKNCISTMMKVLKENDKVGIAGALEFFPNGVPTKDRPFMYWNGKKILDPVLKGVNDVIEQIEQGQDFVDVDLVGSACCIYKREVIDKIGLFDEQFGMGMFEQEDYEYRAKLAGFKIAMCLDAMFVHFIAQTTSFNRDYYQKLIISNKALFIRKWVK
jgi:GT2 family glycosyltransferase